MDVNKNPQIPKKTRVNKEQSSNLGKSEVAASATANSPRAKAIQANSNQVQQKHGGTVKSKNTVAIKGIIAIYILVWAAFGANQLYKVFAQKIDTSPQVPTVNVAALDTVQKYLGEKSAPVATGSAQTLTIPLGNSEPF